jgi:hypothetical protein
MTLFPLIATLPRGYEARPMELTIQRTRNKWALYFRDVNGYSVRAEYADGSGYPPRFESRKLALAWCKSNGLNAGYMVGRLRKSWFFPVVGTHTLGKPRQ